MGFILETKSDILFLEERRESVVLNSPSDNRQIFPPCWYQPDHVRDEIAESIREYAKDLWGRGNATEEAEVRRKVAEQVENMKLERPSKPHSTEVTKRYLRELYEYLSENPEVMEE